MTTQYTSLRDAMETGDYQSVDRFEQTPEPAVAPPGSPRRLPECSSSWSLSCAELIASNSSKQPIDLPPDVADPHTPVVVAAATGSRNERVAGFLALASAFVASLLALDASFLSRDVKLHWSVISWAINAVSLPLLLIGARFDGSTTDAWTLASLRPSLIGRRISSYMDDDEERRRNLLGWAALRAILGGLALNGGVAAIAHLELPAANCIMFSMPCWTVLLACCVQRTMPKRPEAVRLLSGFCGMLIVVAPWSSGRRRSRDGFVLGYVGAFSFAILNAAANIITNRKLQRARPTLTTAAQAATGLIIATVALFLAPPEARKQAYFLILSSDRVLRCIALCAIAFPVSALLRTAALCASASIHVVSLLYLEIPLVLLWDRLLRGQAIQSRQALGVSMIVGGLILANKLSTTPVTNQRLVGSLSVTTSLTPAQRKQEEEDEEEDFSPRRLRAALHHDAETERSELAGAFFALGAGSSITFASLSLAVAELKETLGENCLRRLSLAHNAALLATLIGLMIFGSAVTSGGGASRRGAKILVGALGVAFFFNLALLFGLCESLQHYEALFMCLVFLNGSATAVMQGLGAALGGSLEAAASTGQWGLGGAQISGAGLGVLLPTLSQTLAVFCAALGADDTRSAKRGAGLGALLGAVTTASAAFLLLARLVDKRPTSGSKITAWRRRRKVEEEKKEPDNNSPSSDDDGKKRSRELAEGQQPSLLPQTLLQLATDNSPLLRHKDSSPPLSIQTQPAALEEVSPSRKNLFGRSPKDNNSPLQQQQPQQHEQQPTYNSFLRGRRRMRPFQQEEDDYYEDDDEEDQIFFHNNPLNAFNSRAGFAGPINPVSYPRQLWVELWRDLLLERCGALPPVVLVCVVAASCEATLVSMLLRVPTVPARDEKPGLEFWQHFLATILLLVANLAGFAGRFAATFYYNSMIVNLHYKPTALCLLAFIALLAPQIANFTANQTGIFRTNAAPIATYAAASAVSGFALVRLAHASRLLTSLSTQRPCPIVAQLIWLSINCGALIGSLFYHHHHHQSHHHHHHHSHHR